MGWKVGGSNPGGWRDAHTASCTSSAGSLSRVQSGLSVALTTHPLLAPRSRMDGVIPLPPLYVCFSCNEAFFTFTCKDCVLFAVRTQGCIHAAEAPRCWWRHVFSVTERVNEMDGLESVACQPWTSRLPKMAQPDLDYIGKMYLQHEQLTVA